MAIIEVEEGDRVPIRHTSRTGVTLFPSEFSSQGFAIMTGCDVSSNTDADIR